MLTIGLYGRVKLSYVPKSFMVFNMYVIAMLVAMTIVNSNIDPMRERKTEPEK